MIDVAVITSAYDRRSQLITQQASGPAGEVAGAGRGPVSYMNEPDLGDMVVMRAI